MQVSLQGKIPPYHSLTNVAKLREDFGDGVVYIKTKQSNVTVVSYIRSFLQNTLLPESLIIEETYGYLCSTY